MFKVRQFSLSNVQIDKQGLLVVAASTIQKETVPPPESREPPKSNVKKLWLPINPERSDPL